jgi:hypothetical protein
VPGPGDAPDPQREPVALRDEAARGLRSGHGSPPTPTRVPKVVDSYTWLLSQYCVRTISPVINCGAPEWALVRVTVVSRSPGPAFSRQDNAQVSLPLSRRAREAATTSQHPLHVILLSDD